MKVLLVSFNNIDAIGCRILQSIISKKYDCRLMFINEENIGLIIKSIKDYSPDVIGFSLVSSNFSFYKKLYPEIRKAGSFKIIVGGWQATLQSEECKEYCDIVVKGEAELIIDKVIQDIENNNFSSLYFGELFTNIEYPLPIFDNDKCYLIENGQVLKKEPLFEHYRYGISISRSCSHQCSYCSNSFMKHVYPNWYKIRYRNYDSIIEELKYVKQKLPSVNTIAFYDEVFCPKDGLDFDIFLARYKKEIDIPFYCLFYPGTCSEQRAQKLKQIGLEGVWLGIQSGSYNVRTKIFKRYGSNKKILEQVEIFQKYGIKIRLDVIFCNIFETKEQFENTLQLIQDLPKPFSVNFFKLYFFPNTELTNMALKDGYIDKPIEHSIKETWPLMCIDFKDNNGIGEIFNKLREINKEEIKKYND